MKDITNDKKIFKKELKKKEKWEDLGDGVEMLIDDSVRCDCEKKFKLN